MEEQNRAKKVSSFSFRENVKFKFPNSQLKIRENYRELTPLPF